MGTTEKKKKSDLKVETNKTQSVSESFMDGAVQFSCIYLIWPLGPLYCCRLFSFISRENMSFFDFGFGH